MNFHLRGDRETALSYYPASRFHNSCNQNRLQQKASDNVPIISIADSQ
jgi:hypothetical protein